MSIESILNQICLYYRKQAKDYWSEENTYSIRINKCTDFIACGLWFRTEGCSWAKKGSCLMCNYSFGPSTSVNQMINYVRNGLKELPGNIDHLLISPSGSMLDINEVPLKARNSILKIISQKSIKSFSFETRVETITQKNIESVQNLLGGRLSRVLIGLEVVNSKFRKICINKNGDLREYSRAFSLLKENNISPVSNILIGLPFLTQSENISSSIESIEWSLQNGADYCYLFPVHIKEGTPLKQIHHYKSFKPISLWAYIEVFRQLRDTFKTGKIRPSWYTNLDAYNVVSSPYTCDKCYDEVIELISNFDKDNDDSSLDKLLEYKCSCRKKWLEDMKEENNNCEPLSDRCFNGIKIMANNIEEVKSVDDEILYDLVKGVFNG
jgi:radical SAM enzyme (TIGR01210 family)